MPLYRLGDHRPELHEEVWIAPSADLIGRVLLKRAASVWFGATLRGDNELIEVGEGSNIQDGAVLHTDMGAPLKIGSNCTVGHRAILHGCQVERGCLIGMGATVLNHAVIGEYSLVGAHALVTEGKEFPPRSLILGAPARAAGTLDDGAVARILAASARYVSNGERFRRTLEADESARIEGR